MFKKLFDLFSKPENVYEKPIEAEKPVRPPKPEEKYQSWCGEEFDYKWSSFYELWQPLEYYAHSKKLHETKDDKNGIWYICSGKKVKHYEKSHKDDWKKYKTIK